MKTNDKGSQGRNQNRDSGSRPKQPVNQPGRENPEKTDPTWPMPEQPDRTEPEPDKNDPTRIDPDWNDPTRKDPTRPESKTGQVSSSGPPRKTTGQEPEKNPNYGGDEYSQKATSGEKNYSSTSAGFKGEEVEKKVEEEDKDKENKKKKPGK